MTSRERARRNIEESAGGRLDHTLVREVRMHRGQYDGPINHLPWLIQPVRLSGDAMGEDMTIPEFARSE